MAGKADVRVITQLTQHPQRHIRLIIVGDLNVEQEFFAVGSMHTCYQIRPAVFDPLVLGLQHLDRFGIEAERSRRTI